MLQRIAANYLQRHRNPANRLLHLVGVPLTFVGSAILLFQHQWGWALAAFLGGYFLQLTGHAVEGNDAGEVVLIKKLLGRPYVEFGPESKESKTRD